VVKIAELLAQCPLVGISINHENLSQAEARKAKAKLRRRFKVTVEDPVSEGVKRLTDAVEKLRDR
jgi:uncharacterized NAD-dependent epimerase/dehydratase family protein